MVNLDNYDVVIVVRRGLVEHVGSRKGGFKVLVIDTDVVDDISPQVEELANEAMKLPSVRVDYADNLV